MQVIFSKDLADIPEEKREDENLHSSKGTEWYEIRGISIHHLWTVRRKIIRILKVLQISNENWIECVNW